ncbi:uncharacterized protein [Lolium perenne]|uniref:uncharacterized protein isoform X2 n=1 Tax=Lolium perenne TaxID=4522 RepID=UPI0021F5173B|nr:uncharacterized protein LOC127341949 isoform X2 [Lolium perenne]
MLVSRPLIAGQNFRRHAVLRYPQRCILDGARLSLVSSASSRTSPRPLFVFLAVLPALNAALFSQDLVAGKTLASTVYQNEVQPFLFPDADLYINTGRPPVKFRRVLFHDPHRRLRFADELFRQRRSLDQPSPPTKVAIPGVLVSVRCTEGQHQSHATAKRASAVDASSRPAPSAPVAPPSVGISCSSRQRAALLVQFDAVKNVSAAASHSMCSQDPPSISSSDPFTYLLLPG